MMGVQERGGAAATADGATSVAAMTSGSAGPVLLPVDEVALDIDRLAWLRAAMVASGETAALFYDPTNIRYATGTSNMQVYAGHNACRYVFVPLAGPVVLFEFSGCGHLSDGHPNVGEIRPAISWYHFVTGPRVPEKVKLWAAEIADLVMAYGGGERRIAVDRLDPLGTWELQRLGITIGDGQALISMAKKVKGAEEIKAIRNAVAVCETGMRRMQQELVPGITEQALWSHLHQVNIEFGGEWIETRLLTSGPRTFPWYQECSARVIAEGDMVSFDSDLIGAHGYGADISRSWIAGDRRPSDAQRRLYATAHQMLQHNIALFRGGMTFKEISERAWQLPEPFARYSLPALAHGIGLVNEYPLILSKPHWENSGYDDVLAPGMVICVEAYAADGICGEGVKLEQQILVTETAPELLSQYPLEEQLL
ncbi:MAG TPA: Xaa-Pro peptidase family protein [Terriglobales bacterium]|nr:Xaa-Pro peptidase family protein [Terriglobales bacterium]